MAEEDEVVAERIREIEETVKGLLRLASKPFNQLSLDELNSIKYYIIVLVEALVSLCIHIARKNYNYTPKTYADSIRFITERLGLVECIEDLVGLVRLRNLVVHRYWVIDDYKIYQAIREDFRCIRKLLEAIKKWR